VCIAILIWQLPAPPATLRAGESQSRSEVRASFKFDPERAQVLVPVRIGGKEYPFVLDTGSTYSVFDASLKRYLGEPLETIRPSTPNGPVEMATYSPPDANVGSLPLTSERVLCQDLSFAHEASGYDMYGIVGLDFLAEWIVAIDFDRGRVDILSPASTPRPEWGERIPFAYKDGGRAYIPAIIGKDARPSFFMVDTGCASTGCLKETLFSQLAGSGDVRATGHVKSATLGGVTSGAIGRISRFRVGNFEHRDLRIMTSRGCNVLGYDYLRRYRVTFDFIGGRMFLAKGKHFADHDRGLACGAHLLFKRDKIVVDFVDEKSPASTAGVRVDDVLLTLCGRPVSKFKPLEIYNLFRTAGKRITMTLDRNGKKVEATFTLKWYD
jgi:hypothetical protein